MMTIEPVSGPSSSLRENRPVSINYLGRQQPDVSEIKPTYNDAGLLERVEARVRDDQSWTVFVNNIDYDAKGQRETIAYGADTIGRQESNAPFPRPSKYA